jgi:glutamate/tyrosine decarboxylase-like PLP-dependent enzyme
MRQCVIIYHTGVEQSDSITMDAHKILSQPFGAGCLIVRDGWKLKDAMTGSTGNVIAYVAQDDVMDSAHSFTIPDYSCELSRFHHGLPLWVFLKVFGTKFLCDLFEEKLALAQYFYEKVAGIPGVVVVSPPMLCTVVFWFSQPGVDIDTSTRRFNDELQADTRVFMSPMPIDGKMALRFSVTGFRSHKEHVDMCIQVIRETAAEYIT